MNVTSRVTPVKAFDVEAVRADFPILSRLVHGKPLVYLDSAASAQKPRQVLEAMDRRYWRREGISDQLTGRAGERQVADARTALAHISGGFHEGDFATSGVTILAVR